MASRPALLGIAAARVRFVTLDRNQPLLDGTRGTQTRRVCDRG